MESKCHRCGKPTDALVTLQIAGKTPRKLCDDCNVSLQAWFVTAIPYTKRQDIERAATALTEGR